MMQLDLLNYTPTPEESTPPPVAKFRLGDRVIVHNNCYGKAGTEATITDVQQYGWYATTEGCYHGKWLESIAPLGNTLVDFPNAAELPNLVNQSIAPEVIWHQTKADYYLRMMNRLAIASQCSPDVKRHEITRLHELREQALAEIRRIGGG